MEILSGANTYVNCRYEYGIFEKVAGVFTEKAKDILNSDFGVSNGKIITIAENEEKEISIYKVDNWTWNLSERLKNMNAYYKRYYVRSVNDLAVALWRFENLGTIYA